MNLNALINMIIRTVIRQLVNHGIRGGLARMGRGKAGGAPDANPDHGTDRPSKADQDQARRAKETARTARKTLHATRRINRF